MKVEDCIKELVGQIESADLDGLLEILSDLHQAKGMLIERVRRAFIRTVATRMLSLLLEESVLE